MSQVDPAVFAELPPDVAAELAAALPPSHASFFTVGNIPPAPDSPSPCGPEDASAAQADGRAKAAAKVLPPTISTCALHVHDRPFDWLHSLKAVLGCQQQQMPLTYQQRR